ncbi:MAG: hypothetical protein JF615_12365, partial [Asticcacaulis sp.]|nr:hypothetical protein [Asticcacaulis sp.]
TLFRKSIAFTINAAQHFKYKWPIQYDLKDLRVIEKDRGDGLGQTDVGGFYAYVMLLGHELTGDNTYLEEARKALKGLEDVRFELVYQTNLTAWGLVACLRLWRLDKDDRYLDQSFVFLAGLMHNCELWSSHIGQADAYANFFGVTCLHDGPYMAAYEAFEVFEAFDEALSYDGLPDSMRLLMSEYRRYALDVLWSFYPDSLPAEGLARKIRNGHIDRALSFPLEDIYGDGSEAGQVGQEVYGAGSAFVVAARAYHDCGDAPFRLFADYFVTVDARNHEMRLQIKGPRGMDGRIRLIAKQGDAAPSVWIEGVKPQETGPGFVEYRLASDALVTVVWS